MRGARVVFAAAVAAAAMLAIPAGSAATEPVASAKNLHSCSHPSDNIFAIRANIKCGRALDVIARVRCYDGCTKWKSRKFKCKHESVPSREGANFRCSKGNDVVKWKTRS
jgi:curli biogenesis system outer membrane secretion channel CsgG